jgi:acyl-CoA synthetase (AMP-forming)/AMP-acid ligase II
MNLSMLLDMIVDGAGDRILVGPKDVGLDAAGLHGRAFRTATRFAHGRARNVALVDLNSEAVPIALFGAGLAGIPFAPLNYRLADDRLVELVDTLVPAIVVAGPDVVERLDGREGVTVVQRSVLCSADDVVAIDGETLGDADPDAIAVVLFTSGTTGAPKAAILRHRHLVSYVIGTVDFMSASADEAQLVAVPPYHIAGVSAVLTSLYAGRRIVYISAFDAHDWVATAAAEAVTHAMVVPTMLDRILDEMELTDVRLPALRHLAYGGGRMPVEVVERAMSVLPHVDFVNGYGLTETSSTISVLGPDDHRIAFASADVSERVRLRSVGRPLPGVEVEIRDGEGVVVPTGARGAVFVRGEQVAGEYVGRSLLTDDGWFPTNDAGYFDAAGFLYLEGRLDDVIVRGAENLSPGEIEDVLRAHEAVEDACVVGIPDVQWGEMVAAVVVITPGAEADEDALKAWVRERLRSSRTPELIAFRDSLPYTETGKLLRRVLRDELSQSHRAMTPLPAMGTTRQKP